MFDDVVKVKAKLIAGESHSMEWVIEIKGTISPEQFKEIMKILG